MDPHHHAEEAGYRTSSYSSSSAQPFSAADAYAQYDYSSQSQHQQQPNTASQHRFPSQPSTNRDSVLSRAPGNPYTQNRWSANRDVESNSRPPPRQQHADSDGEEDDDEDEGECCDHTKQRASIPLTDLDALQTGMYTTTSTTIIPTQIPPASTVVLPLFPSTTAAMQASTHLATNTPSTLSPHLVSVPSQNIPSQSNLSRNATPLSSLQTHSALTSRTQIPDM